MTSLFVFPKHNRGNCTVCPIQTIDCQSMLQTQFTHLHPLSTGFYSIAFYWRGLGVEETSCQCGYLVAGPTATPEASAERVQPHVLSTAPANCNTSHLFSCRPRPLSTFEPTAHVRQTISACVKFLFTWYLLLWTLSHHCSPF